MKLSEKQKLKLLQLAEIVVDIKPEDIPIEGNASAIDDETDKEIADEIYRQLESGNELAWCCIQVKVTFGPFTGLDTLGCCSYKSLKEFKDGQYFADMVSVATDDLIHQIETCGVLIESLGSE